MARFVGTAFGRGGVARTRPEARLRIECLEDRTAPAVLQVVGTGGDNTTTFNTFAQAYAASTSPGDVIQIEPAASDVGPVTLDNTTKALTVTGDPSFATAAGVEAADNVAVFVSNANLTHLYVNGTVTLAAGVKGVFVSDGKLGGFTETAGTGNGGNTLQHDEVRGNIILQGGGTASAGDQIVNCAFESGSQLQIGQAGAAAAGVLVGNTTFEPAANTGIVITDSRNITVTDTRVTLTSGGAAVAIDGSSANLPLTGLDFRRDDLRTENGTGIHVTVNPTASGAELGLVLEGNAFEGNQTGVAVTGTGDVAAGSVLDAGGGGNSVGGNEFRLNVSTGIAVNDPGITANHLTVFAAGNSIAPLANPVVVSAGSVSVNQGANLTNQQAFVQSLYHALLAHTASLAELNYWVSQVPVLGQSGVATAIVHSQEGLTRLVDKLYDSLLGRNAGDQEAAYYVNQFGAGATEEQVITQIVASPEFAGRANALEGAPGSSSDQNFIRALYAELLGRTGESAGEDSYQLAVLIAHGRSGTVAGLLQSFEFRNDYTRSLYTDYSALPQDTVFGAVPDLMCRSNPPAAAETAYWANARPDLLSIAAAFASSDEFFTVR